VEAGALGQAGLTGYGAARRAAASSQVATLQQGAGVSEALRE
jgi:hypothetical protein